MNLLAWISGHRIFLPPGCDWKGSIPPVSLCIIPMILLGVFIPCACYNNSQYLKLDDGWCICWRALFEVLSVLALLYRPLPLVDVSLLLSCPTTFGQVWQSFLFSFSSICYNTPSYSFDTVAYLYSIVWLLGSWHLKNTALLLLTSQSNGNRRKPEQYQRNFRHRRKQTRCAPYKRDNNAC